MKISGRFILSGLWALTCAQIFSAATESGNALQVRELLAAGRPVKIACFGDSITGVYYHTGTRRAWCDLLGLALQRIYPRAQLEMIHAGVSGNDTSDALKRMEKDVLSHSPKLVVVMFGMNDVRSQTPEAFRDNLKTIVQRAQGAGAEVILMTPNPVGPDDPVRPPAKVADYVEVVRGVGRELGIPVVDAYATFAAIQKEHPAEWQRLMSDSIHPNMRGHKIFAEQVAFAITGQRVSLATLPALRPGLPFVLARLQAHQPVRVMAMTPFDTLIAPALRSRFPDAVVEVTPWSPDPLSLPAIEAQAKERGWDKFRGNSTLPRPDLVIVAVPATARAPTPQQFYHSYYWTMNWSLSSGLKPGPEWDCLVVLPSVNTIDLNDEQRIAEKTAVDIVQGQDIPWLIRRPGDRSSALELLANALDALLDSRPEKKAVR